MDPEASAPANQKLTVDDIAQLEGTGERAHEIAMAKVDLVAALMKEGMPILDVDPVHRFVPGMYARELTMPAGSVWISKIHKTEHFCVALSGLADVWTEESGVVRIEGPRVMVTKPGTRRVLFILEEATWVTFHPINETDVDVIESQIIEPRDIPSCADAVEALAAIAAKQLAQGDRP